MKIEPQRSTLVMRERLAHERNPVLRRNLEIVAAHVEAEINGDLDGIMATLTQEPVYHGHNFFGHTSESRGSQTVRDGYATGIAAGRHQLLQLDVNHLVVDAHCVVAEGFLRLPFSGETLIALGCTVEEPGALYWYQGQLCVFFPFSEDHLLLGEDVYFDSKGFEGIAGRKVRPEEMRRKGAIR